jgi:superfamily II DNA or RNA helicase
MKYTLRDYQSAGVRDAVAFLRSAQPAERRCYAAPTGTGKSVVELAIQDELPDAAIIVPRLEIAAGMLDKRGVDISSLSEAALIRAADENRIFTPIRLRNRCVRGEDIELPPYLIIDEGHHDSAATYRELHLLLGHVPAVCFTATPFRGTPKGTAEFRAVWGDPVWLVTMRGAVNREVLNFPDCSVWPLVDDDEIEIVNGEFHTAQVEAAVISRLAHVAERCGEYFDGTRFDKPTMFALPSREAASLMCRELESVGLPCSLVTGETSYADRQTAFTACEKRDSALVQIAVVSEGVDLKVSRLIDLAPCMSPVKWLQQVGRITRPTKWKAEYVCTNRNLLRHAYLLEGLLPQTQYSAAQKAFEKPSTRTAARAIGLEALGRLKGVELPFRGDITGLCYSVSSIEGTRVTEYTCIVHPLCESPLWALRERAKAAPDGTCEWGKWRPCEPPTDLTGFTSVPPSSLSDKQKKWWETQAHAYGLDNTAAVNRKNFQALPVLSDLRRYGVKLKPQG